MKNKVYSRKDAFAKAAKFCAYQERTQQEVREKLQELGFYGDEAEDILCDLIGDNFINEERFARAYAGGKFRLKKWGRKKIEYALKQKGLSAYCIQKGLEEIDTETYLHTLISLLTKKKESLAEEPLLQLKNKLANYVLQKGYESELVWGIINEIC